MKRSNPSMNKPSLNKLDSKLSKFTVDEKSKYIYIFDCPVCGNSFEFRESDLKDRVVKCPKCKYEEIFFRCNYM